MSGFFNFEEATHYYIYVHARRLITFAFSEFIAWVVLGMGISHSTAGPIEKVFILISPRHII